MTKYPVQPYPQVYMIEEEKFSMYNEVHKQYYDCEDPRLFGHQDPENNRIPILKEQNIDQNHLKIIPKFSKRTLFFLLKQCNTNMEIFHSYII